MPNKDDTTSIKDKVYPLVDIFLSSSNGKSKYKKLMSDFFSVRSNDLYDMVPCSRLICQEQEMDKLFEVAKIDKKIVTEAIENTYYGPIREFNPKAAKHEFTVTQLMCIRYLYLKKLKKETELAILYLAFSGKFYPSIHYRSYPTVTPVREVMEYVVNNKLSKKFDIVSQGSVMGAIRSVCMTWLDTYEDKLKDANDDDVVYLVQQLHSRIGSFMKNIAEEYYSAYEDKDNYLLYSSDDYSEDNYHLADNDMLRVERITEKTLEAINRHGVDYQLCKMCSDENITTNEVKSVIESILSVKENIIEVKELVSLMITTYFSTSDTKDVKDISFLTYAMASKPNAKQKEIVRQKEIIEKWLCDSGTAYMRRRSRIATRNSYERAVRFYFALQIHNANR